MADSLNVKLKDLVNDVVLKKYYVIVSKTKSFFNRDLTELPNIKLVVSHYISEHPFLAEYPVVIMPNFPNAYYNMVKQDFRIGLFNANIVAHEIEHALSLKDADTYKNMLIASKVVSALTSKVASFAIPAAAYAKKEHEPHVVNALDVASIIHALSVLPNLYEEGKANINAVASAPDRMSAMKQLAPAYGTYLLNAAIPLGLLQGSKRLISNK